MKNILDELYNGKINPGEEQEINKDLKDNILNAESELNGSLSDKEKELFLAYESAESELEDKIELARFKQGFKLGVRLFFEALK